MEILILTYIVTAALAIIFIVALLWGVTKRQFNDDYAPPRRILFDNKTEANKK